METYKPTPGTRFDFPENVNVVDGSIRMKELITSVQGEILEKYEKTVLQKIKEIAKEQGYTSVTVLNEDFIYKALAKAEPMKAEYSKETKFGLFCCPRCGRNVCAASYETMRDLVIPNYCYNCGQALKDPRKEEDSDK